MNFSYFISIVLILLGISLIGTVLQNKIRLWSNSQNMFFGCIGGLVAYFCDLPIVGSIIVIVICMIISWIIFKYCISKDTFIIRSEKLKNFILFFAISAIFIGIISFTTSDLKIIFKNPIFAIAYLFIIITGINGIPKFMKFIQIYNPDEFKDGEIIYIVDNFFDKTQNSMEMYNNKKFHFESMHFIINRECIVENSNGENTINLNGIKYSIIEKNSEVLRPGDNVKISKENLDKGMIRKNNSIIVEKISNKNEVIILKFVKNNLVSFAILSAFFLISVFVVGYSNNFYRDTLKTIVIQVGEVQVYYGDGLKNLKDVNTTVMDDITYYCDVTVNYKGDEITFKEGRQTVRELPSVGEEIIVYKDKNGNINSYTSKDKIMIIIFIFAGILCGLLAILSIIIKNKDKKFL